MATDGLQSTLNSSDGFIIQQAAALVPLQLITAHGLLGQTHSAAQHRGAAVRYIEGVVDDYVVSDLLAHDFMYRFHE